MILRKRASMLASVLAITTAAALALSSCSSGQNDNGGGSSSDNQKVTLSFGWWGNDTRTAITMEVIKAFEHENPNITIEPQHASFDSYFAKLATQAAGGSVPDIMQMDEEFLATYAANGVLMDLNKLNVSFANFSDATMGEGTVDGSLYAISVGDNATTILANPSILAKAGVPMPDDKTWTWQDLANAAAAVSKAGDGKFFGVDPFGFDFDMLKNWAHQHGEQVFGENGDVAISPETLVSWWKYNLSLHQDGSAPAESATVEALAAGTSGSFFGTNKAAFATTSSNQLTSFQEASGSKIDMLLLPATSDASAGWMYLKPSQFWAVSAKTKHSEAAAKFLDFLCNSQTAGDILKTERAIPANSKVRAGLLSSLSDNDKAQVAFLKRVQELVGPPAALYPPGGSAAFDLFSQYTEEVMFKKKSFEDAAKGFIADLQADVDKARR